MTNTLRAEALEIARQEALASGLHRLIIRGIKQAERDHPEIAVGIFRGSVAKRVAGLILADYDVMPKAKTGGETHDTGELQLHNVETDECTEDAVFASIDAMRVEKGSRLVSVLLASILQEEIKRTGQDQ